MSCVAPGCTSNYKSQEQRTPSFAFPIDEEIREKWFRAIPRRREDYEESLDCGYASTTLAKRTLSILTE